jgi:glycosyltransferase Alg8
MSMSDYQPHSSTTSYVIGWILLCSSLALFSTIVVMCGVPEITLDPSAITLGTIATWRYSWAAINLARAAAYQFSVFPSRRRSLRSRANSSHIYVVVLSYRMGAEINVVVYGALIRDLKRHGRPATVVACISDPVDFEALEAFEDLGNVRLILLQQSNKGKRDAMERGLALLAQSNPPRGAVVALMDGDTVITEGTFDRTVPFLVTDPELGALTTDNVPLVAGPAIAREWYRLRMRTRHELMSSVSLSERVLVLTGRFSLFRAEIALSPGFIAAVGHDGAYHGRLGRIGMLTGDDKSTWFCVLRRGWKLMYVPDVVVYCLEKPPRQGFCDSTVALMFRYFGNMARNNTRALRLGPRRVGWFTWLVLLDQRVSPWTSLWGPVSAVALTLFCDHRVLPIYLCWVLLTRTAQCAIFGLFRLTFHPLFPFLQFYNQIVGAGLKVAVFFNPDKQSWTRQLTGRTSARHHASSAVLMWLSLLLLTTTAVVVSTL